MMKLNGRWPMIIGLIGMLFSLCACGSGEEKNHQQQSGGQGETIISQKISYDNMHWEAKDKTIYAQCFQIEKWEEYELLTIEDSGRFLLVPKGSEIPADVPSDVVVLHTPIDKAYLAASSGFDLVRQLGEMDRVAFSGTKEKDLYIAEAKEAIEKGSMVYAGKYSAPDYELLLAGECSLAIESTMIYHSPATKEKLEALGIPVLVERSSYESHPLGRLEWIKVYGALFGREQEAKLFWDGEIAKVAPVMEQEKTECSVAFFYVNTNGVINVRKPGDYVAKMISLAGGEYVPASVSEDEENALSTMNMQMEDFYLAARDADVLIYNGTITGALESIDDLVAKNVLFADFKAVRENRVYGIGKNVFQETTAIASLMEDIGVAMRDSEYTDMKLLTKLK